MTPLSPALRAIGIDLAVDAQRIEILAARMVGDRTNPARIAALANRHGRLCRKHSLAAIAARDGSPTPVNHRKRKQRAEFAALVRRSLGGEP